MGFSTSWNITYMKSFIYDLRWCIRPVIKNSLPIIKYVLITPWYPANKFECYKDIILFKHFAEIANNAVSFSGVVINLNNNNLIKYIFLLIFHLLIVGLVWGNLFCTRFKNLYLCRPKVLIFSK